MAHVGIVQCVHVCFVCAFVCAHCTILAIFFYFDHNRLDTYRASTYYEQSGILRFSILQLLVNTAVSTECEVLHRSTLLQSSENHFNFVVPSTSILQSLLLSKNHYNFDKALT